MAQLLVVSINSAFIHSLLSFIHSILSFIQVSTNWQQGGEGSSAVDTSLVCIAVVTLWKRKSLLPKARAEADSPDPPGTPEPSPTHVTAAV